MQSWLGAMRIKTQLALLVGFILVVLAGFSFVVVQARYEERQAFLGGVALTEDAVATGTLIHDLQNERGLSQTLLATGAEAQVASRLQAQRAQASQSLARLQALASVDAARVQRLQALARGLQEQRARVDARSIAPAEVVDWYSAQVAEMVLQLGTLSKRAPAAEFTRQLASYFYLVAANDAVSRERAVVNTALSSRQPLGEAGLRRLATVQAEMGVFDRLLREVASPVDLQAVDEVLRQPEAVRALEIRAHVMERALRGDYAFAQADWYTAVTAKMDGLKKADDALADRLIEMGRERAEQAWQELVAAAAITAVVVAASLALAYLVSGNVRRRLARLQDTMTEIGASFDFSRRVQLEGRDEIAQAGRTFDTMMQTLARAVAEVDHAMQGLAAGDFSRPIQADLRGDMGRLKQSVNQTLGAVDAVMKGLSVVMEGLQRGNFSVRARIDAQGEFDRAAQRLTVAVESLDVMMKDIGAVMTEVARGDLRARVTAAASGDLQRLKDDINGSLQALCQALRQVHDNARQVAAASAQTSTAIEQISDGAQNQTVALGQVTTAVRQTTAAVGDVARNTEVASRKSRESVDTMRSGMQKMTHMVEVVGRIVDNSEKVSRITEVIEKIANKTNMLSLNAAIEAARAGEHGKGFAVVADEVGKLAASTALSSREIADLVREAVAETARAVQAVEDVRADMASIEQGSSETSDMLQRIAAAIEQQSSAVEEINANLSALDRVAKTNAAASEEITATVIELSRIADSTREEVERFQV